MSTASTTVVATVKQDGAVFVCTLNGVELGRSKHNDYFEYHAKRGDVKALREANLTHVDYVDAAGTVIKSVRIKDEPVADATAAIAATVAAATAPAATVAAATAPAATADTTPAADAAATPAATSAETAEAGTETAAA